MAHIETAILSKSVFKSTVWKRYIDDFFSLWDISKPDIETFIEEANLDHPTIKFTTEISDTETVFRHNYIKAQDSTQNRSLMLRHILRKRKPSSTQISPLVTHQVLKKDLSKGKPLESYKQTPQKLRLGITFQNSKKRPIGRGYPQALIENLLSDIKFAERESAPLKHNKEKKETLPFVTQYQPSGLL